jgi:two-component system secretion response regulator SsrB
LDDNQSIAKAFEAGANGYQLNIAEPSELIYAVEQVLAGNCYISPSLLPKLIQRFSFYYEAMNNNFALNLSDRERQMLKMIACGIKNKAIADSLFLSIRTVESHRYNLMKKLNAHNAADLTTIAVRMGMV